MGSELPELHPVVIPPIYHRPFRCKGNGLMYRKYSRESISDLRSWLTKKRLTKKRSRTPFRRAKDWWRAQLLLYGLDAGRYTSSVAELTGKLESALMKGLQGPSETIIDLENELNAKFRIQKAESRDKQYSALETDESRVEFYPKKFWKERFPSKSKRKKDDFVKIRIRYGHLIRVQTAAESLGLCVISVNGMDADFPGNSIIVGPDRRALLQVKAQMDEQRKRARDLAAKLKRQVREAKVPDLKAQSGSRTGIKSSAKSAKSDVWRHIETNPRMLQYHILDEVCDSDSKSESRTSGENETIFFLVDFHPRGER